MLEALTAEGHRYHPAYKSRTGFGVGDLLAYAPEFATGYWATCTNTMGFMAWRAGTDPLPAYRFHRTMLQVLQHGGVRGRWTLKSPHHAIAMEPLNAVYPDAHLVLMHRDPVKLCGSVCSLIACAVLLGLANSVYHPADYAILAEHMDEARMGRAFSIHTFAGFLGGDQEAIY